MSPKRRNPFYIGLVHHPVYNKNREIIATSITNLDLHDIARAARTYNVDGYFIIHPLETQQNLAREIAGYWTKGFGASYNADRKEAFSRLHLTSSVEEAVEFIKGSTSLEVATINTDARVYPNTVDYLQMRNIMAIHEKAYFLLFGTGWGIEEKAMAGSDYILEPVYGGGEYNHLSVRSAVSIILDRLLGEEWWSSSSARERLL